MRIDLDSVASCSFDGRIAKAPGVRAPAVKDVFWRGHEHDLAMAQPVQVVDEHARGLTEVQIEDVNVLRVPWQSHKSPWLSRGAKRVKPRILVSDVEKYYPIDHVRRRDPFDGPRAI